MSTFSSIDEARNFFAGDKFAGANGMTLERLTDDGCVCAMEIRDDHRNALGGVMGGVIFTLADFALAIASNNDHKPSVALEVNINYLSSTKGTRLIAEASRVKSGRTTGVYSIMVTDDTGRDVALVTGTCYKL